MSKTEQRLIVRIHQAITLYQGVSYPPELYDHSAKDIIVAVYPLQEQQLASGLLALGLMEELSEQKFKEKEKVYTPFAEEYLEDIKIALPIIQTLATDEKTSMTVRRTAAVNQMISRIFFRDADILWPPILTA